MIIWERLGRHEQCQSYLECGAQRRAGGRRLEAGRRGVVGLVNGLRLRALNVASVCKYTALFGCCCGAC